MAAHVVDALAVGPILVAASFGPVANERRLTLDNIDIYDDLMRVNYRLRPGERDGDEDAYQLWDLEVEDELGTARPVAGAAGPKPERRHRIWLGPAPGRLGR